MPEEKLCPNCNQPTEDGAKYCGNCGYKLENDTLGSIQPETTSMPPYAIPKTHHKQHWAAMALAFGVLAIGGGLLIPILGVAFAMTGIVLATSSYRITHGWLKPISVLVSVAALIISIGIWVNVAVHNAKLTTSNSEAGTSGGVATVSVTTPCYTLSFNTELNVNNSNGSCTLNAYNGTDFQNSSDIFKILASQTNQVGITNFDSFSKQAIESDVSKNLAGFNIIKQANSIFGGSPAYYVTAYNSSTNVSVIEETVLHEFSKKDNFFVLVHATNGRTVNLNDIEVSWQWHG